MVNFKELLSRLYSSISVSQGPLTADDAKRLAAERAERDYNDRLKSLREFIEAKINLQVRNGGAPILHLLIQEGNEDVYDKVMSEYKDRGFNVFILDNTSHKDLSVYKILILTWV